jgi:hypothetical protein
MRLLGDSHQRMAGGRRYYKHSVLSLGGGAQQAHSASYRQQCYGHYQHDHASSPG